MQNMMTRSDAFMIGGPKLIKLLLVDRNPILLFGECHHKRGDGITVVHMIRQLMECAPTTRLLIEKANINGTRHKTDRASNQVGRTGAIYADRTWSVDLKKISKPFNRAIFTAASDNMIPVRNKKVLRRFRKKLCKVLQFVYDGYNDPIRLQHITNELFIGIPYAYEFLQYCIHKFATIPSRMQGDMRPMFKEYISKGYVNRKEQQVHSNEYAGGNPVQVNNIEGAYVFAVSLINDMYTCDIILSKQSPIIFYGGATHCAHIDFILNHCYPVTCVELIENSASRPCSTEIHLSVSQHKLIIALFCAHVNQF